MICENCKLNNASLVYTHNTDGKSLDYNLCSTCAKKIDEELLFIKIFKQFFADFNSNNLSNTSKQTCYKCGNSLDYIKNSGKMGCENCYKVFNKSILSIIKNFQFDNKHLGKFIKKAKGGVTLKRELDSLKLKLKAAVAKEDYEMAIILRNKINEIERGV